MSVGAAYQPQTGDIALLLDGHCIAMPVATAAVLQAYLPEQVAWVVGVAVAIGQNQHPIQIEAAELAPERERPDDRIARKVEITQANRAAELEVMRAGPVRPPRNPTMPIGSYVQWEQMASGAGSARALMRDAWPETHEMLGELAVVLGERPLPLLARLINEEAARQGLRRTGEV